MILTPIPLPPIHTAQAVEIAGQASVIDGDTIEIAGRRIRIHGIDAPESRQICTKGGKEYRCGQQSALELSNWIARSVVSCVQVSTDRYKRVVARCSVRGEDLGRWSVSNGWALDWPQYSRGDYNAAQSEARAGKRGVWRGEFVEPWVWRKR